MGKSTHIPAGRSLKLVSGDQAGGKGIIYSQVTRSTVSGELDLVTAACPRKLCSREAA